MVPHQKGSRGNRNNRGIAWPVYSTGRRRHWGSFDPVTNPHTLVAILRKAVRLSIDRIRADETYPSVPIDISDSTVMEDIAEGWRERGLQPMSTFIYLE